MLTGKHLIAGQWVGGETTFKSAPATGEALTFSVGTPAHVDAAVKAAEAAFPSYAALTREERATFLRGENDVNDDEAQGLRHGDGAGFQPFDGLRSVTWGVAPGWDGDAPLALSESPFQTASMVDWMRSRLAAISVSNRAISFW